MITSSKGFLRSVPHFSTLVKKIANTYNCIVENTAKTFSNSNDQSILAKIGMTNLYLSNCEKDLGAVFLLLDNLVADIKQSKKNWGEIVMLGIMEAITAKQGYSDCRGAVEYIISLFK